MSSHANTSARLNEDEGSVTPEESLLGRIMHKRQRVNSEAATKKQDFSFMPTLAAKMTRKDVPSSLSSPTLTATLEGIKSRRDLKASEKSFNLPPTASGAPIQPMIPKSKQQNQQFRLPKVEIRVPDLLGDGPHDQ